MGLMTEAVYQFKSIKRILDRQEQKAEFEEKNPPIPDTSMYGWPYGVASPLVQSNYSGLFEKIHELYGEFKI
jgi:hypothetical protein